MMIMSMMEMQDEYDSGNKNDDNVNDNYDDATKQTFLQEIQDASIVHIGLSMVDNGKKGDNDDRNNS